MKVPRMLEVERFTPIRVLGAAVVSLLVALGTVLYGHIAASPVGPWLSIAFSAGAVACTILSLLLAARR